MCKLIQRFILISLLYFVTGVNLAAEERDLKKSPYTPFADQEFLLPSADWLVSQLTPRVKLGGKPGAKIDKQLSKWISQNNRRTGENLGKEVYYYLASLYLRYVLRDRIKLDLGPKILKKRKSYWIDLALKWAKNSIVDLDNPTNPKNNPFYLSNLASLYAIKITYSSFPFLIYYVKKFQFYADVPLYLLPNNFEIRYERMMNYAISSYRFYKEGKDILETDLNWIEERLASNSTPNLDSSTLSRKYLHNLAHLAVGNYYLNELEDRETALQLWEKITHPQLLEDKKRYINQLNKAE